MCFAWKGIIPPKEWYHRPELSDKYGWTVAKWLAFRDIIPPKEWYHSPEL